MDEKTKEQQAQLWAEWLGEMLDELDWRQADLVHRSGGMIKRDRVSKWLSGKEGPSHRNAIVVANTLGVDAGAALRAAGYEDEDVDLDRARDRFHVTSSLMNAIPTPQAQDEMAKYSDSILLGELLRRAHERETRPRVSGDRDNDAEVMDELTDRRSRRRRPDVAAAQEKPPHPGEQEGKVENPDQ